MGVDVYGVNPKIKCPVVIDWSKGTPKEEDLNLYYKWQDETPGSYFRNNWWWWRPLWDYAREVVPMEKMKLTGDNNEGDFDQNEARVIGRKLLKEIESGRTREYEHRYLWKLITSKDVKCDLCKGTGKRPDMPEQEKCNGCDGVGHERPWETHYPFSVENVKSFAEFCMNSGGFQIR